MNSNRSEFSLQPSDQLKGFDFTGHTPQVTTLYTISETKDKQQPELPAPTATINYQPEAAVSTYTIRDLIQDDQMFRLDCDPAFFEATIEESNLNNNNIGLGQTKDWDIGSWISTPSEFIYSTDLPESLFEGDTMEKKETPPASPLPALPSQLVEDVVEVKSEVKSEHSFDLIRYIIFGEVSQIDDFQIVQLLEQ